MSYSYNSRIFNDFLQPDISFVHSNALQNRKFNKNGNLAAALAAAASAAAITGLSSSAVNLLDKFSTQKISKNEQSIINSAVNTVLNKITNLSSKGYNVIHIDKSSKIKIYNDASGSIRNNVKEVQKGSSAFLYGRQIFVNKDSSYFPAVFHELGHAFNRENSKFYKTMQNLRNISMVSALTFLLMPLFLQEEKEKNLNAGQKIKNTLIKFSLPLAFISYLPVLLEEAKASFTAGGWIKQLLDKTAAKKAFKINKLGFLSYFAPVIAAPSAFKAGKFIKNKLQHSKK